MRILLIVHGFPPLSLGGTEIYTHDLARALCRKPGVEVVILSREGDTTRPEFSVRREARDDSQIFWVNTTFRTCRSFEETYRLPSLRRTVARIIDEIEPDVAHIQHLSGLPTDLVADLASKDISTFFTLNDFWLICQRGQLLDSRFRRCPGPIHGCANCADLPFRLQRGGGLRGRLAVALERLRRRWLRPGRGPGAATPEQQRRVQHTRWIAQKADLLLAPSETLRQRFLDWGAPADRIVYLPQGIDQSTFQGQQRTASPRLRFAFFGTLMVSKAPHLLLEAFAPLPCDAASVELYGDYAAYHGDDSYRWRLERLLKLPGVRRHGPVPHREVARALASVDVLVVPSVWLENAPFIIREAFAAGVPVVASELGGMAEMVRHEENGLLFRAGDAADLGRCLRRLLDDRSLLDRLASNTRPGLTIEEDAEQLLELYRAEAPRAPRAPRLAAVVLNYRTPVDTILAARSLSSSHRPVDDVFVVDNGSHDGSRRLLEEGIPGAEIIASDVNLGFSAGSNLGIRRALDKGAELIFLLNGDAMVTAECLGRLEQALDSDPEVGIAGPVVLARSDPDRVASAGMSFGPWTGRMRHRMLGKTYDPRRPHPHQRVAGVDGCALLIRREILEGTELLDEDYFFSFEDLDLCLQARRRGFSTISVGDALAYHAGGLSLEARSPWRIYFGTRNHLLLAAKTPPPLAAWAPVRAALIVTLNAAHAVLSSEAPLKSGLEAFFSGLRDHWKGRYGAGRFPLQDSPELPKSHADPPRHP